MADTLPLTSQMTAYERTAEARACIESIRTGISSGASFKSYQSSSFYVDMRDRLLRNFDVRVTPDELKFLRKIAAAMKGKKKK